MKDSGRRDDRNRRRRARYSLPVAKNVSGLLGQKCAHTHTQEEMHARLCNLMSSVHAAFSDMGTGIFRVLCVDQLVRYRLWVCLVHTPADFRARR